MQVKFWSITRKIRKNQWAPLAIRDSEVIAILRYGVILQRNTSSAVGKLVSVPGLKGFCFDILCDNDRALFQNHLHQYACIYLPDCPFEISTTD
jgi:histone-lysine N-methyltransferase SUV420H